MGKTAMVKEHYVTCVVGVIVLRADGVKMKLIGW